jgi:hypothetical protein
MGVDVHRQIERRVPHRLLRGPRPHAGRREHRAERVPQGVDVDRPAAALLLRDAGGLQIPVENP